MSTYFNGFDERVKFFHSTWQQSNFYVHMGIFFFLFVIKVHFHTIWRFIRFLTVHGLFVKPYFYHHFPNNHHGKFFQKVLESFFAKINWTKISKINLQISFNKWSNVILAFIWIIANAQINICLGMKLPKTFEYLFYGTIQ